MAMVSPEVEGPMMVKTFSSSIDQDRRDPFSNWSGIVSAKAGVIKKGIVDAMIANMRTKLTVRFPLSNGMNLFPCVHDSLMCRRKKQMDTDQDG